MPTFMELTAALVKADRSDADRSLGLYLADDMVMTLGECTVPFWNGFMNEALTCMVHDSAIVRQFAASTIGNASCQPAFAQVVPAAATAIHTILSKQGVKHRRRRAVKAADREKALAVDACVRTLGQICQAHEGVMGADASTAWGLWLSNLPLKYNADASKAAHGQLVSLLEQGHPMLTSMEQLPRVLAVLADSYKAKYSAKDLDKRIAAAIGGVGEDPLKAVCGGLTERQQKKVEQILKVGRAGA